MQYESILLELMERIQALEEEIRKLKAQQPMEGSEPAPQSEAPQSKAQQEAEITPRQKMTEDMMQACFAHGVRLFRQEEGAELRTEIDAVVRETGMNRNSAIMCVYAVRSMLEGELYKRAISARLTEFCFERIRQELGEELLKKAIEATRAHIRYRQALGHKVDGLAALCDRYENQIG